MHRPLRPLPRARPLARLRRRPLAWWLATLVLAAVTGQVVSGAVGRAERDAARYGGARPVLVMTSDVAAGTALTAGAAEVRVLPAGLVPEAAVGAEALGRRVRSPLFAGEVVHASRLAPSGLSAAAAALPAGTRGVAVPAGPDTPPLEPGDVVDVLATVAAAGDGGAGPPTVTVAAGAVVVATAEGAVTVAVPREDSARVAYASTSGMVTLALVGG